MRADDKTHTLITALAEQTLAPMGLSLWGVELMPAGKRSVLRVYVDVKDQGPPQVDEEDATPHGVLLDDLAEISRRLSVALDAEDLVPGSYVLEVSSPGLERTFFTLEQIEPYVGRDMEAVLHDPCLDPEFAGRKRFSGKLVKLESGVLTLIVDNREVELAWSEIRKAHLVHRFDQAANRPKRR